MSVNPSGQLDIDAALRGLKPPGMGERAKPVLTGETLGERIKQAYQFNGWRRADAVRAAGVSRQSISAWEKGASPRTEHLIKFANATGYSLTDILGDALEERPDATASQADAVEMVIADSDRYQMKITDAEADWLRALPQSPHGPLTPAQAMAILLALRNPSLPG